MCSIDYRKALDCIKPDELTALLRTEGLDETGI